MKKTTIELTKVEAKALDYVLTNGYGNGDIFGDGLLDKQKDQEAFFSGWEKIEKAKT